MWIGGFWIAFHRKSMFARIWPLQFRYHGILLFVLGLEVSYIWAEHRDVAKSDER